MGEAHDQQHTYVADNKQLGTKGLKLQNSLKAKEGAVCVHVFDVSAQYGRRYLDEKHLSVLS